MEKILIFERKNEIENMRHVAKTLVSSFNNLNMVYKSLDPKFRDGFTKQDLQQVLTNEFFLEDKLISHIDKNAIAGLPLKTKSLRNLVELPEGSEVFKQMADEINMFIHPGGYVPVMNFDFDVFDLDNELNVVINETVFNTYVEPYKTYISTEAQKEKWKIMNDFIENLNKVMIIDSSIIVESDLIFRRENQYFFTEYLYSKVSH